MTNSLIPTASDSIYFLRFMLFVGIIIIPVGSLILRLFRVQIQSRVEKCALIFVTGTLFSNSLYFLLRLGHLQNLCLVVFSGIFILFLIAQTFQLKKQPLIFRLPTIHTFLLIGILLIVAFYHFHRTWHAILWMPDGKLVFWQNLFADPIWKLSVASELEHSVPPQMPIFAGVRLTYHYFMELFTVFVHFMTKIDLISLRFFIIPFFSFFMTGATVYAAFKHFLGNARLALFSVFMIMISYYGCVEDAHVPFAISIYLCLIILMSRGLESKNGMNWILCILMMGHTMLYEAIVSATFLAGLSIASILIFLWRKRIEPLMTIFLGSILMIAVQTFAVGRIAGGDGQQIIGIQFPFFVGAVKDYVPLKDTLKGLLQAYHSMPLNSWGAGQFCQLISVPFLGLAAIFLFICRLHNISVLAIPLLINKLKYLKQEPAQMIFIVPVLVFGLIFPLIFSFPFLWAASFRILFNTVFLLIGFVPLAIYLNWTKSRIHKLIICIAILFLFILPIIKMQLYFKKYSSQYGEITKNELQIFNYLRTQTPPESVLMHPFIDHDVRDADKNGEIAWVFKDHYYFGSALGGRRVVLEGSKQGMIRESTKLTPAQIATMMQDIDSVYKTQDASHALEIIKKYKASYLWVPRNQKLQFDYAPVLKLVVSNSEHTLYQVIEP